MDANKVIYNNRPEYPCIPMGLCQKCKKRQATLYWTDNTLSFIHGFSEEWCNICAVTEQLRYANELAAKIPMLESELAALLADEQD
jgi:hypothetical protein